MATVGTSWTNIKSKTLTIGSASVTFYIQAKYDTQDTSNNQTKGFQTRLRSVLNSSSASGSGYKFKCTYCDTVSGSGIWTFSTTNITTSSEKTITHESDGTKSLSLSATVVNDYWGINVTFSGTATLPTINRLAYITSASDFNDEQNPVYYFSNPNNYDVYPYLNFYDYYTGARVFEYSKTHGDDLPNIKTYADAQNGYTLDISGIINDILTACNTQPNYRVTIGVDTYNNDSKLGYNSKSQDFLIINANPTFTKDQVELNTNINTYITQTHSEILVDNASRKEIVVTVTPKKQAYIKEVWCKFFKIDDEQSVFANIQLTETTQGSNVYKGIIEPIDYNNPFETIKQRIFVKDSRNKGGQADYYWDYKEYSKVNNSPNATLTRVQQTSTFNLDIDIDYTSNLTLRYQSNSIAVKWQVKDEVDGNNDPVWHTIPSTEYQSTATGISISNYAIDTSLSGNYEIDYKKSGTIKIYAEDMLSYDEDGYPVVSSVPTFDAGKTDFNINGELYVSDETGNNQVDLTPFRAGTQQEPSTYTFPSRLSIGGFISTSTTEVLCTVYLSRPIQSGVEPTITAGTFIIRGIQGYVNGSQASATVTPTSSGYTITARTYGDNAIEISILKSSAYTNISNNTPVSVCIGGLEITFVTPS